MALTSTILFSSVQGVPEAVSSPLRVDSAFGHVGRIFTVAIYTSNFQGTIRIEASLATDPEEDDWFPATDQIQYTRATGIHPGHTEVTARTFPGNFVWLRAKVIQSAFPVDQASPYGFVDKILVNY